MSENERSENTASPSFGGIYISRGMRLKFPAGGITISINDNGQPEVNVKRVEVCLDPHVHWLEIALQHLDKAERAHITLLDAWQAGDKGRKSEALETEFAASLQGIVAAAIAVDACYAMVRRYVEVPADTLKAWRKNRTSRPRQITEVLRLSFRMNARTATEVQGHLKELFKWRDWGVHPPAEFDRPVRYDELGVATEWRFVAFRAENTRNAVKLALSLIAQLPPHPKPEFSELTKHCNDAIHFITPLVERWEQKYGELYPRDNPSGESASGNTTGDSSEEG